MKLKTLNYILSACSVIALTLTAIALVTLSYHLRISVDQVTQSAESVQAAEELQIYLLSYNRETYLASLDPQESQARLTRIQEEERQIWRHINEIGRFTRSSDEEELVDAVLMAVHEYMGLRKALTENHNLTPADAYLKASAQLREAITLVRTLTELNIQQAHAHQLTARRANDLANLIGIIISVICVVIFPLTWFIMSRWVYEPIWQIHNFITKAKDGDQSQRIPEIGIQELGNIGSSFNELLDRLNEQKQNQLRFIAGVAHDLRNPLNAIQSSSEILSSDDLAPLERKALLDVISRQSHFLEKMVGDLLDSSRIESGHLELQKVNQELSVLIEDSVRLSQQTTSKHQIVFIKETVTSYCDPVRIMQVINNVIINAIKYSPEGGQIRVQLSRLDNNAVISVTDSGIGISPDDIHSIFEPFRRTQDTKSSIPGIGLGLSVTKKIIEAHGGHITVKSKKGEGSTFCIYIPCLPNELSVINSVNADLEQALEKPLS